jgi:hypothetical protein
VKILFRQLRGTDHLGEVGAGGAKDPVVEDGGGAERLGGFVAGNVTIEYISEYGFLMNCIHTREAMYV